MTNFSISNWKQTIGALIGFFFICLLWVFYFSLPAHASSFQNCSNFIQLSKAYATDQTAVNILTVPENKTYYFYSLRATSNDSSAYVVLYDWTGTALAGDPFASFFSNSSNGENIYYALTAGHSLREYVNVSTGDIHFTLLYTDGACVPIAQTTNASDRDVWMFTLGLAMLIFYGTIQIYWLIFK